LAGRASWPVAGGGGEGGGDPGGGFESPPPPLAPSASAWTSRTIERRARSRM
jgi:hypothetical protein